MDRVLQVQDHGSMGSAVRVYWDQNAISHDIMVHFSLIFVRENKYKEVGSVDSKPYFGSMFQGYLTSFLRLFLNEVKSETENQLYQYCVYYAHAARD